MTTRELELEIQNRELLLVQQQLAQSKMRYADLFDFAPIGYVTLGSAGRIQEVNIAAARLLGGTPQQFIGRMFSDFLVESDRERLRSHLNTCRESSRRLRTELHLA